MKSFYRFAFGVFLFTLPLQTRLIISPGAVRGEYFEYATVSLYATELLALVIIAVAGVTARVQIAEYFGKNKKIVLVIGALVLLAVVSAATSTDPLFSCYTLAYWSLAAGMGVVAYTQVRERPVAVLGALWAGGVVQALLAMQQFFSQSVFAFTWFGMAAQRAPTLGVGVVENAAGRWLRAYGSFGWPTSLGIYLALMLVLGALLALRTSKRTTRAAVIAGQTVIAAGLFVTFARGAWVAAAMGLAIVGAVSLVEHLRLKTVVSRERLSVLVAMAAATLCVVGVYAALFAPLVSSRFAGTAVLEQRSINERVSQYHDAFVLIKERPLFGVGPGLYTRAIAQRFPERAASEVQVVHNMFVLQIAQLGLALALFLASLVGWAIWRHRLSAEFLALSAVCIIAGLFDHWLISLWAGIVTLAVGCGCACGIKREP